MIGIIYSRWTLFGLLLLVCMCLCFCLVGVCLRMLAREIIAVYINGSVADICAVHAYAVGNICLCCWQYGC